MLLDNDRLEKRPHVPELLNAGRELLLRVRFRRDRQQDNHDLVCVAGACLKAAEAATVAAEVADRLRLAIAAHETYSYQNDQLLKVLLSRQPEAVLDALFNGDMNGREAIIDEFSCRIEDRSNPANEISSEDLISWCDKDRETRYLLAASIVTFASHVEKGGPKVWSDQAQSLFTHAPDPRRLLAVFLPRFRPSSWSGSRAALMQANADLLDSLTSVVDVDDLEAIVKEAKDQLEREIARERQWESKYNRIQYERFE